MVSVIIPTLNAAPVIGDLLGSLKKQTVETECIIIDSASTDDTVSIAREMGAKTIVIRREDFDHGATRSQAAREAKGDTLVFMTQDAYPCDENMIANLIKPLEDAHVIASFARQVPRPDAIPPEQFARSYNYPSQSLVKTKESIPELGVKTFFFSNVCSAVRRDLFNELGGYAGGLIMDEDLLFAANAILQGYGVAYAAEARVFHSHNYSCMGQFKRYFDTGVFFRDNEWLLQYARLNNEGTRLARKELATFAKEGKYRWVFYVFLELLCKFAGFKLGLYYRAIPRLLRKQLSLHRHYWDKH